VGDVLFVCEPPSPGFIRKHKDYPTSLVCHAVENGSSDNAVKRQARLPIQLTCPSKTRVIHNGTLRIQQRKHQEASISAKRLKTDVLDIIPWLC
jgi:hypothetical protein